MPFVKGENKFCSEADDAESFNFINNNKPPKPLNKTEKKPTKGQKKYTKNMRKLRNKSGNY